MLRSSIRLRWERRPRRRSDRTALPIVPRPRRWVKLALGRLDWAQSQCFSIASVSWRRRSIVLASCCFSSRFSATKWPVPDTCPVVAFSCREGFSTSQRCRKNDDAAWSDTPSFRTRSASLRTSDSSNQYTPRRSRVGCSKRPSMRRTVATLLPSVRATCRRVSTLGSMMPCAEIARARPGRAVDKCIALPIANDSARWC